MTVVLRRFRANQIAVIDSRRTSQRGERHSHGRLHTYLLVLTLGTYLDKYLRTGIHVHTQECLSGYTCMVGTISVAINHELSSVIICPIAIRYVRLSSS